MGRKKRGSGLGKFQRKGSGIWILRGKVRGIPVWESTGTTNEEVAEALRIKKENELLQESVFGKEAVYTFDQAVVSYLKAKPRSDETKYNVKRLLEHFQGWKLRNIDQIAVDDMYTALVPSGNIHPKITLITFLNAIMEHAAFRRMCSRPLFEKPKPPSASTPFFNPDQATALVRAAALHLRPLLVFLIGVGCRPEEALSLDWGKVDLKGRQVILTLGKVNKKEHVAPLRPVVLRALQSLPHRDGRVFRTWLTAEEDARGPIGPGYTGGRFVTAWETACAKAGLPGAWVEWVAKDGSTLTAFKPEHNPYSVRHTFATWYRCAYKDLADLRDEIGWTTTRMGERYGKKLSRTYEPDVLAWWNGDVDLNLSEVEEVSCNIRARLGLKPVDLWSKLPDKSVA